MDQPYDLVSVQYEVIFPCPMTGEAISDLVKSIVGDKRHYRCLSTSGSRIDIGAASLVREEHVQLVPERRGTVDYFYIHDSYDAVRVHPYCWPVTLNDEGYRPFDHLEYVVALADALARRTNGSFRQIN